MVRNAENVGKVRAYLFRNRSSDGRLGREGCGETESDPEKESFEIDA